MADPRRKVIGRRIRRARLAAGYRTQRDFAQATGISEASVANAESGSDRTGSKVFAAIEDHLDWPEDCIAIYLGSGDLSTLPSRSQHILAAMADRILVAMTRAEIFDLAEAIEKEDGPAAADDFVRRAYAAKTANPARAENDTVDGA